MHQASGQDTKQSTTQESNMNFDWIEKHHIGWRQSNMIFFIPVKYASPYVDSSECCFININVLWKDYLVYGRGLEFDLENVFFWHRIRQFILDVTAASCRRFNLEKWGLKKYKKRRNRVLIYRTRTRIYFMHPTL